MGNSAIRSVTVPVTGAATAPTEPVCVTLDSTGGSAIYVSHSLLNPSHLTFHHYSYSLLTLFIQFLFNILHVISLLPYPACPKWAFGPGCSEECHCVQQNTLECHRRHGTCVCKPGWQGNACREGQCSYLQYLQQCCSVTQARLAQAVRTSVRARLDCLVIM
jgi:hypothetical protein